MGNTVTLTEYLERKQSPKTRCAFTGSNGPCDCCEDFSRRTPRWIERMNEGKLPNKDLTGKGPDAA